MAPAQPLKVLPQSTPAQQSPVHILFGASLREHCHSSQAVWPLGKVLVYEAGCPTHILLGSECHRVSHPMFPWCVRGGRGTGWLDAHFRPVPDTATVDWPPDVSHSPIHSSDLRLGPWLLPCPHGPLTGDSGHEGRQPFPCLACSPGPQGPPPPERCTVATSGDTDVLQTWGFVSGSWFTRLCMGLQGVPDMCSEEPCGRVMGPWSGDWAGQSGRQDSCHGLLRAGPGVVSRTVPRAVRTLPERQSLSANLTSRASRSWRAPHWDPGACALRRRWGEPAAGSREPPCPPEPTRDSACLGALCSSWCCDPAQGRGRKGASDIQNAFVG